MHIVVILFVIMWIFSPLIRAWFETPPNRGNKKVQQAETDRRIVESRTAEDPFAMHFPPDDRLR